MIRLRFSIQLGYEILDQPADFIFNIHAAHTRAGNPRTLFRMRSAPSTVPTQGLPAHYTGGEEPDLLRRNRCKETPRLPSAGVNLS